MGCGTESISIQANAGRHQAQPGRLVTAGEIAALFEHTWPTTTRHMRVLESAELVRQRRKGRTRVYRIDRRRLELAGDWIAWFFRDPG